MIRWLDLSSHNTPTAANLAAWRALGFSRGVARLSVGLLLDARYLTHRANLRAAGYLTGAYSALHEDAPMAAQCRKFIAHLPDDDELPPWADVERKGLTAAMIAEWFDCWEQEAGGRELWFYTGRVIERLVPLPERERYGRYPLVMAAYPYDTPAPQPPDRRRRGLGAVGETLGRRGGRVRFRTRRRSPSGRHRHGPA